MYSLARYFQKHKELRCSLTVAGIFFLVLILLRVLWVIYFVYLTKPHPPQTESVVTVSTTTPEQSDGWVTSEQILEEDEMFLPSYSQFLDQLQQTCPYYQPSGVQYRDCIAEQLVQNDKMVGDYAAGIISDLGIFAAELKAEAGSGDASQEALIAHLTALEGSWRPYRDSLCSVELDITYGGNDQSALTDTCELYQDALYYGRLQSWQHEWLDEPIQVNYKAVDTPIKTRAFRELIYRTGVIND